MTEECRYIWINDDYDAIEIPEDEISGEFETGTVLKITKHGNGKVTVFEAINHGKIVTNNHSNCDKISEF